jgi:signal transduction histidine kinase
VFVVDDDISVREYLGALIRNEGWQPRTLQSAKEFLSHPHILAPGCLILEISLPDLSGLDLQKRLVAEGRNIPIIFIAGYGDISEVVQAMKAGAVEFLTKPFGDDALLSAIRQAFERSRTTLDHEVALAHVNRLSMMGELAASLTHEILQPIASARNNARAGVHFLEMSPPNLDEVREALDCIVRDADRANDIVDRMRDHVKKAPPRREHLDLNHAVGEIIVMVRRALAKNRIAVNTHFMEGPVPVQGDRVQLQQVVMNLILNAVEAMGSVEVGSRELSISIAQDRTGVLVAVRDSGPGIDPTNLERVFKAFYTTKPSGVGMGLSICRSIIDAHGGRLWAEANEPRGAVFQFTLPGAER